MSRILSVAQQGLWLVNQLRPEDADYHVPAVFRLRGPVDPAALRTALDRVSARHAELRSVYPIDQEGPFRQIRGVGPVPWTDLSARAVAVGARAAVAEFVTHPFDLCAETSLRAAYLPTGADEAVLALNLHHIASDAVSLAVVLHELGVAYAGAALPPTEERQAQLAEEQAEWLRGPEAERTAHFWRTRLTGYRPLLPGDEPVPPTGRPAASHRARLDRHEVAALSDLARGAGATLPMVLLAGWATTVGERLGRPDVVVGMPVSVRGPRDQDTVGCLVNMLPIRLRVEPGGTLDEDLVARARDACLAGYRHAALPAEQIAELVRDQRPRMSPLVEAAFDFAQGAPRLALPGVRCEAVGFEPPTVQVPLDLQATRDDDSSVRLVLRYDHRVLSPETTAGMLRSLVRLLRREPATVPGGVS